MNTKLILKGDDLYNSKRQQPNNICSFCYELMSLKTVQNL